MSVKSKTILIENVAIVKYIFFLSIYMKHLIN